jgi:hypothetical protein
MDWSRRLRFLHDELDDIPAPEDRLAAVEEVRNELRDILTGICERACWELRASDRLAEAAALVGGTYAAQQYARRYNGRLAGAERVRWNDPLTPYRRKKVRDITQVTKHKTPHQVHPRRAEGGPDGAQKR